MKHERIFDQDGIGRRVHPRVLRSKEPIIQPISTRMVEGLSNADYKKISSLLRSLSLIERTRFRLRALS